MIISHKHHIVFLHIPKCGGTSIRNVLKPLHDDDPIWDVVGWRPHPILGRIGYGHLPLYALREHFPLIFQCISKYSCFAIVRDPKRRFVSSLSEYTRVVRKIDTAALELGHFIAAAEEVCGYLGENTKISDHSYIHFEKQVNYIRLDGEIIVDNLYHIRDIQLMIRDISLLSGEKLRQEEVTVLNQSRMIKSGSAKYVIDRLRPNLGRLLKGVMPLSMHRFITDSLYTPVKGNDIWDALPRSVKNFVLEYYVEDQSIHDDMNRNLQTIEADAT